MAQTSVPAQDIIDECTARGYLAKQLYVVFTRPSNGIRPIMELLASHLAFQEELERTGVMFAAGPNWTDDESAWQGDGMVVYRAGSLAEAREIAARDPMHVHGARSFQVRPWFVNEGTINLTINFATGRFKMT